MKANEMPNGQTEGPRRNKCFMLAIAAIALFALVVTSVICIGADDSSATVYTYGAGETWEMRVELVGDSLSVEAANPGTAVIPSTLSVTWKHGEESAKYIEITGFHGGSPRLFAAMTNVETIEGDLYGNAGSYRDSGKSTVFYSPTELVGTWEYNALTNTLTVSTKTSAYNSKLMPNFTSENAPWTSIPTIGDVDRYAQVSHVIVNGFCNIGWKAFYGIDVASKNSMYISGPIYEEAALIGSWNFTKTGSTGVLDIKRDGSLKDMPVWLVNTFSGRDDRPWSHGTTYQESGIEDWEWYSSVTTVKVRSFQNYDATNDAFKAIDTAAIAAAGEVDPTNLTNRGEWLYYYRAQAGVGAEDWFHTNSLVVKADTLTTMPSWAYPDYPPWKAYTQWVSGVTDVYIMGYNGYPSTAFSMMSAHIYTVGYAYNDLNVEIGTWEFEHTSTDKNFMFVAYNSDTVMPKWSITAGNDKRPWAGYSVVIESSLIVSVGKFSNFEETNFYDFVNAATRQIIGAIFDGGGSEIGAWTYNNTAKMMTLSSFTTATMIAYTAGGAPWYNIVSPGSASTNVVEHVEVHGFVNISKNALYGFNNLLTVTSDSVRSVDNESFKDVMDTVQYLVLNGLTTIEGTPFNDAKALKGFTSDSMVTIPQNAFKNSKLLEYVNLDKTTKINNYAFSGCTSLISIMTAPAVWVGDSAFANCKSLEDFNSVGDGVYLPSALYVGATAFQNCTSLLKATIGNVKAVGTTQGCWGDSVFAGCTSMTTFYSDSVTELRSNMFSNCNAMQYFTADALTSLGSFTFTIFPNIIKVSLTSLRSTPYYAFKNCTTLEEVVLPTYEKIGVYTCSLNHQCFYGCTSLSKINLDAVTFSSSYVFYNCTSLTSESVNSITEKAGNIYEYTFYGCKGLTGAITLRNTGYLSNDCFRGCSNIVSVDMSPNKLANKYLDTRAFYLCTSLETAILPDAYTSIGSSAFSGCTKLTTVTVPGKDTNYTPINCTNIYGGAFYKTAITEITCPSVIIIGDSAFKECSSLVTVVLPAVQTLDNQSFRYCTSLKTVIFPTVQDPAVLSKINEYSFENTAIETLDLSTATFLGYQSFMNCKSLKSVNMPYVRTIGGNAFANCNQLMTVTSGSITSVGNSAFSACTVLEEMDLREVLTIGESAFNSCNNLTLVVDDDGSGIRNLNKVQTIGSSAFVSCVALTSVYAPLCTYIGGSAFQGDREITIAVLDSIDDIQSSAFRACTKLSSVSMSVVSNIGSECFYGDSALKYVLLPHDGASSLVLGNNAFYGCTALLGTNDTTELYLDCVITISYRAFYNCTSLFGNLKADSVTTTGSEIFYNCDSIISVSMNSATILYGSSFSSCDNLEKFTGEKITRVEGNAFHTCSKLVSANLPSVTVYLNAVFYNCKNLKRVSCGDEVNNPTIVIAKDVADLTPVETIGSDCFENTGITEFKFGTVLTKLGDSVFYGSKASSLVFPNSLEKIGGCLTGGSYIREIVIPSSLISIGRYLFYYTKTTGDLNVYFNGGLDTVQRDTSGVLLHLTPTGATTLNIYMPTNANIALATVSANGNVKVVRQNVPYGFYNISTGLADGKPTTPDYLDKVQSINGSKIVLPYSFESVESRVYSDYYCVMDNPYAAIRLGTVKAGSTLAQTGFAKSGDALATYFQADGVNVCLVGEVTSDSFKESITIKSTFQDDPGDETKLNPESGEYRYGEQVSIPTLTNSKYAVESVVAYSDESALFDVGATKGKFCLGTYMTELRVTIAGHTVKITFIDGSTETVEEYDFGQPYGTLPSPTPAIGYKFKGWFTQSEGGYQIKETTKVTGEMRLYSQYEPMEYQLNLVSEEEGPQFSKTLVVYGKYTLYLSDDGKNNLYVIDTKRTEKTLIFDSEADTKETVKGYKLNSYWVDGYNIITDSYTDKEPKSHDILLVWKPVTYSISLSFTTASAPLNDVYIPGLLHGSEDEYYDNGDAITGISYSELEAGYEISVPMHQQYTFEKASVTVGTSTIDLEQDVTKNCKMIVKLEMFTAYNQEELEVYFEFVSNAYRYQFCYNDDNKTVVDTTELISVDSRITTKPAPSTKSGYVFSCWQLGTGPDAMQFAAGESITLTREHLNFAEMGMLKFNAVWEVKKYTIHFDLGEFKDDPSYQPIADYVQDFNVAFDLPIVTDYLGHTLATWSWVSEDGTMISDPIAATSKCTITKDVSDEYSYGSKSKPELKMVASWVRTTYTVMTYETSPTKNYNDISVMYLDSFVLWDGSDAYVPASLTDYQFAGWVSEPSPCYDNMATVVIDDTLARIGDANKGVIEFKINWVQKEYRVKYDLNGGNDPERVVPTTIQGPYKLGSKFEPPSGISLVKEGYTYKGWTYNKSTLKEYEFDGTFDSTLAHYADENNLLTLYVYWEQITYNITYDFDGGAAGQFAPKNAAYGSEVEISNPVRTGYSFSGWTATNVSKGASYCTSGGQWLSWDGETANMATKFKDLCITKDGVVSFKATWDTLIYDVKYVSNAEEGDIGGTYSTKLKVGDTINLPDTSDLVKTGYKNNGWGLDEYNPIETATEFTSNMASYAVNNTITFYGVWSPISYKIIYVYYPDYGEMEYNADYGSVVNIPSVTRIGYTFLGWSGEGINYLTAYYSRDQTVWYKMQEDRMADGSYFKNLTTTEGGEVRLIGNWSEIEYKIKYTTNSTSAKDPVDDNKYKIGSPVTLVTNVEGSSSGKSFLGWSFKQGSTETVSFTEFTATVASNADITNTVHLYGVWSEGTYTVTVDLNGCTASAIPAGWKKVSDGQYAKQFDYNTKMTTVMEEWSQIQLTKESSTFSNWEYTNSSVIADTTVKAIFTEVQKSMLYIFAAVLVVILAGIWVYTRIEH